VNERTADIDPRFDARFQRGYAGEHAGVQPEPTASPPEDAMRPEPPRPAPQDDPADLIRALVADREASDPRPTTIPGSMPAVDLLDEGPEVGGARRVPTGRLWMGLAASLLLVVAGLALVWNAATDRSVYTGTASGSEGDAIRFLASVAPGFIQAGALGCVVVLVVWAVLARSTAAVEGEE
jgi:hypothetical protein